MNTTTEFEVRTFQTIRHVNHSGRHRSPPPRLQALVISPCAPLRSRGTPGIIARLGTEGADDGNARLASCRVARRCRSQPPGTGGARKGVRRHRAPKGDLRDSSTDVLPLEVREDVVDAPDWTGHVLAVAGHRSGACWTRKGRPARLQGRFALRGSCIALERRCVSGVVHWQFLAWCSSPSP